MLDLLPSHLIENIAYQACTEHIVGPPSALAVLTPLNRSLAANISSPHLLARLFAFKFDRPKTQFTVHQLANELRRRCRLLSHIRLNPNLDRQTLAAAFLLLLENQGTNHLQLTHYARLKSHLLNHILAPSGTLSWKPDSLLNTLALWGFWLLLIEDPLRADQIESAIIALKPLALAANKYPVCDPPWQTFHSVPSRLTLETTHYSQPLTLHIPPLSVPAILSYHTLANINTVRVRPTVSSAFFGWNFSPQPLQVPRPSPSLFHSNARSSKWNVDFQRCTRGHQSYSFYAFDDAGPIRLTSSIPFRPGSLEGVWEGIFTFTEFANYAILLGGASPRIIEDSSVAVQRQAWKLREYYLFSNSFGSNSSGRESRFDDGVLDLDLGIGSIAKQSPSPSQALPTGPPLSAFIPSRTTFHESDCEVGGLSRGNEKTLLHVTYRDPNPAQSIFSPATVPQRQAPGQGHARTQSSSSTSSRLASDSFTTVTYRSLRSDLHSVYTPSVDNENKGMIVEDILLIGEGHSSWGQFTLHGRVRPCDGVVSLIKEYTTADRGKWLYRGYLIGSGPTGDDDEIIYQNASPSPPPSPPSTSSSNSSHGNVATPPVEWGTIFEPNPNQEVPGGLDLSLDESAKEASLVGRWRDTLSPEELDGYEGCFIMTKRGR